MKAPVATAALALALPAYSGTLRVPSEYATINAALDATTFREPVPLPARD